MKTKSAWLWVVLWHQYCNKKVSADLFFSTPTRLFEIVTYLKPEQEQLVEVQVPIDFDDWDYVPDNY